MSSGGARSRSGPSRDPNALRRDRAGDQVGWTTLPVEGRSGDVPPWPLPLEPSAQEWDVWSSFWRKPQAVIWERDQIFEPVAMFVRQYIEGTEPNASAENRKTVRLMFADLYLTSDSLARAHMRIGEVEQADASKPARRKSARDRLTVVPDDGA